MRYESLAIALPASSYRLPQRPFLWRTEIMLESGTINNYVKPLASNLLRNHKTTIKHKR